MLKLTPVLTALALLSPVLSYGTTFMQIPGGYSRADYSICSNIYSDSQKARCMQVVGSNYIDPQAISVCNTIYNDFSKVECLNDLANRRFDSTAVRVCTAIYNDSQKQSCMVSISDQPFDANGVAACAGIYNDSQKLSCMSAIAGKAFDPNAISVCTSIYNDNQKIDCLRNIGMSYRRDRYYPVPAPQPYDPYYRPQTPGEVIGEILLDSIDQILRDVIIGQGTTYGGNVCRVQNSTGKWLGDVSESQLEAAGQNFARKQGECVKTSIKGVQRSHTLIDSNGRIVGRNLSEKRTRELQNGSRCRVMECTIQ